MIRLSKDEFLDKIKTSSLWYILQMEAPFEVQLAVVKGRGLYELYFSPRLDSMTVTESRLFIDKIWELAGAGTVDGASG